MEFLPLDGLVDFLLMVIIIQVVLGFLLASLLMVPKGLVALLLVILKAPMVYLPGVLKGLVVLLLVVPEALEVCLLGVLESLVVLLLEALVVLTVLIPEINPCGWIFWWFCITTTCLSDYL